MKLCATFGWKWFSGSEEVENVKCLQTDGQTDVGQKLSEKLTGAVSSGELKCAKEFKQH